MESTKGPQPCPLLLFLLLFLFLNSRTMQAENQELELLLSFKSSLNDPSKYLSNWNTSATFCNWLGITCTNSSHISVIQLSGKNMSGKISSLIFHLPYIQTVDLSSNQLSGKLPDDIFFSSSLRYLNLSNNNFTGPIPSGSLPLLETLDLSNNMLSGKIPEEIGSFWSLKFLDLGGNVLAEIGQLISLNHLNLVYNNLIGQIPTSLGNLTDLQYLFLYQNKLTGPIPKSIFGLTMLISLDLSDNFLSGEIPELIIKLKNLEILHLFSNNLSGKIPVALSTLPRLQVLQLWSNKLSGEIPNDLGKHNNLTVLDLSTNFLSGRIPEGLCSSGNLFKLILFSNSLEGEIPKSLSACKSLRRIRLQENGLFGELPSEFTKLPLVYFLDISANKLLGRIDSRKWEMPSLQMLSLARNSFLGGLPDSFGSDNLENLDLSHNQFSGAIPDKFGRLSDLMQLNLSKNKLSGEIPDDLSSCEKLVSLDLSQNKLSGAFLAINASAVTGNNLCGGDKTSGLPPCRRMKSPLWWFYVACSLGALVLLALAAFGFVFIRRKKEFGTQKKAKKELHTKGSPSQTNTQFILKKTNDVNSIPPSEVAELGKLQHPNVVKLFGLCRSNKSTYAVHEYIDGKKLSEVLRNLSWERRQQIAIGIAKALRFLHCYCSTTVLVGYMSPEKIIIDGKDEPHLIASLPGLLCVDDTKCFISSAYAAPETRETKDISERSDMYGFGLVLIELLTGKCPADAEFGEHGSIVKWARYCYSDCHLDVWIDPMIRGNASINQNEMVETMNFGSAMHSY
ncbi:DI-GLUCOSE BINDING PROTEIN WITH LEUCINE-RICH REPEAT DOMAIN-CONTAINING PROTEIN [Salix koriyanagi]|uniref:DI-GLUCOSE BINDING PROTEIN WITH LEUCINE-RICH REPEAT DOMAIN-CONTAINING PROTEIN n=1 Tax=Salix koriyanagi TaxID=2511006 RepID=A0A9Q1A593_9ROSI|nr:DI-GLUCOSE BINDING PROTEIN WITH LEUCINE-RICH REPEAT DOMAIN-CONTAINING PROTEIN [Salix koriyanagi]